VDLVTGNIRMVVVNDYFEKTLTIVEEMERKENSLLEKFGVDIRCIAMG
jgi:hypothetical protein